ncbi:MAG: hypothetical protein ABI604_00495 [Nitrospirota bacterium]
MRLAATANQLTIVDKLGEQLEQHAKAAAVVEIKKTELAKLTTGMLLEEFLDDPLSTDGYLKDLTVFSRVRNDFENLSDLMTKSNEDYVALARKLTFWFMTMSLPPLTR